MGKRLLLIILTVGSLAVGGTWLIVENNAQHILEEQARSESLAWAEFVRKDVPDLERLLTGAPPTIQDMHTLSTAKNVGNVFWFKIYDHDRTVVWSHDFREVGNENRQPFFLQEVVQGHRYVKIIRSKEKKKVIAIAFLPIMDGAKFQGAIEVSLDLTHVAADMRKMTKTLVATIASFFLFLLLITTFFVRQEIQKERALRAEAMQAAKARNDFIALISHELRTPLNGILGALGLLRETDRENEKEQLIHTAIHSTEHLQDIINDIIDFTQLAGKRAILRPQPIYLGELCDELDSMFKLEARDKGLFFEVIRAFAPDTCGSIDLKRLRQIVFNLVSNAIKFTERGHITIIMRIESGPNRHLIVRVEDTGIGIPPKEQTAIFERFHQVGETMSREHGGIGLGLSLCKQYSTLMGGDLSVSSVLGKGTIFRLEVPLPPITEAPVPRLTQPSLTASTKLNLLVAEDNKINQKVIKAILENVGHNVTVTENGRECIAEADKKAFDLILMDIQMPRMTGLEATNYIRQNDGPNNRTTIVALSANIMPDQQESYLEGGMQGCIAKPVKPEDLRQAVLDYYHASTPA